MIQYPDDVYIIKIPTRFGSYYWTGDQLTPFTHIPLKAARFHDMQNALGIARQLNHVLCGAVGHHFYVALYEQAEM